MRPRLLPSLFLLTAVCAGGCTRRALSDCATMGAPDDLVRRAALLRIDTYPPTVACEGAGLAAGAGPATSSRTFAPGAPYTLELPPGKSTLLLSAFSDPAGTLAIGSACSQVDLQAGSASCLELRLEPVADGGISCSTSTDCPSGLVCCEAECVDPRGDARHCGACGVACGSGEACCESRCLNVAADLSQCGGCARACGGQQVAVPACSNGLCASSCTTGFANCIQPAAPASDDGCETDLAASLDNCGACGRPCTLAQASATACVAGLCEPSCQPGWGDCTRPVAPEPDDGCESDLTQPQHCGSCAQVCALPGVLQHSCVGTSCGITSCQGGFQNCDAQTPNGCECAGTGCCTGACQTAHSTGLGQTFFDCVALGTYDQVQATRAAQAWDSAGTLTGPSTCGAGTTVICMANVKDCACWGYADTGNGATGRVRVTTKIANNPPVCNCPDSAAFPLWN